MGDRLCRLLLPVIVALVAAGCAAAPTAPVETPIPVIQPTALPTGRGAGGTLRLLYWQAPTILNPHLTAGSKDREASRLTYEPLASYDKDGKLVLFLAEEIPTRANGGLAPDGMSVTWKLKRDVKWSDGESFTAEDVRFTYEYVTNKDVGAATANSYTGIKSVEALDYATVRINFNAPNPAWSLPFVGTPGMILPRHVFEAYKGANAKEAPANTQPVGTGPYRVLGGIRPQEVLFLGSQLIETNKIVFEPNPFFREPDKPFFSRVELHGGGTVEEAARAVLQDGTSDYAWRLQLPADQLAQLTAGDKGAVLTNFGSLTDQIVLNRTDPNHETPDGERSSLAFPHPFLSDKLVRQAFSYAIDRERLAALYGEAGRPTSNNLLAPPDYVSPNTAYEFNLAKAAALLAQAGWTDHDGDGVRDKGGIKMQVLFQGPTNPVTQEMQQIIQADLQSLQIEVEITFTDSSIFYTFSPPNPKNVASFYADLEQISISSPSPDPGTFMQYWTCDQIPQKANNWQARLNFGRWCNLTYDTLYKQSTTELDYERRRQIFIKMNDLLIDDVAMIPLAQVARLSAVSKTLAGVDLTPWDVDVWNIKDWRSTAS